MIATSRGFCILAIPILRSRFGTLSRKGTRVAVGMALSRPFFQESYQLCAVRFVQQGKRIANGCPRCRRFCSPRPHAGPPPRGLPVRSPKAAARWMPCFRTAMRSLPAAIPRAATPIVALQPLPRAVGRDQRPSKPDLVVACDDRAVGHLRDLHAETPLPCIERSLGDPSRYDALASRSGFVTAAREAGIAAPETVSVDDEAALDFALRMLGVPAVLKSDGSWGGDGVAVVHTAEQARDAWRKMSARPSRLRSLARAIRRGDAHHLLNALRHKTPSICLQRLHSGTRRRRPVSFAVTATSIAGQSFRRGGDQGRRRPRQRRAPHR